MIAASNGDIDSKAIDKLMSGMSKRVFIMRSIYEKDPILFQTRWTLSYLRGPLTLAQIELLTKDDKKELKSEGTKTVGDDQSNVAAKTVISVDIPQYFVHSSQISFPIDYRPFIAGF